MTWTAKQDSFTTLCTILDGSRVVAENVGKGDAERIVESVNEAATWPRCESADGEALWCAPHVFEPVSEEWKAATSSVIDVLRENWRCRPLYLDPARGGWVDTPSTGSDE